MRGIKRVGVDVMRAGIYGIYGIDEIEEIEGNDGLITSSRMNEVEVIKQISLESLIEIA